jgi:hypothetical protein
MDFRSEAKSALERARVELASNAPERLKYAALELRTGLEAITYDRMRMYKDDIPPEEYATWQPKKVMQLLLDIDPYADQGCVVHIGIEKEYGKPSDDMKYMGTEQVLSMSTLKKHYDALGSYLHMPTSKQIKENAIPSLDKLRIRCGEIAIELDKALSSGMFNVHLGSSSTMECFRCNTPIRRHLPLSKEQVDAKCFNCNATYIVTRVGDQVSWQAKAQELKCPTNTCESSFMLYEDQMKQGTCWTCEDCKESYILLLKVAKDENKPNQAA